MEPRHEITRQLAREHEAVGQLLGRFARLLASADGAPPDWSDPEASRLVVDLRGALAGGILRHFDLEERELFPLHREAEGDEMADLLLEDHRIIRGLIADLRPLLDRIPQGLDQEAWNALRATGTAFATELAAHAQKEDEAFMPVLDDLLEPGQDRRIAAEYREAKG